MQWKHMLEFSPVWGGVPLVAHNVGAMLPRGIKWAGQPARIR